MGMVVWHWRISSYRFDPSLATLAIGDVEVWR